MVVVIVGGFIEPIPAIIIFMPEVNVLNERRLHQRGAYGRDAARHLAFGLITPTYGLALLMATKFVGVRFTDG